MCLSKYRPLILKTSSVLLFIGLLLVASDRSKGQNRAELERQRRQKEREIGQLKKRLSETNVKERQTLSYLNDLNDLIGQRQSLIGTMQDQVNAISQHIEEESDIVAALDHDVDNLKQEYAKLLYYMYKNRKSTDMVSFVFAANSFNEALKRIEFIRFYSAYRKNQVEIIEKTEESLASRITDLRSVEQSKKEVLASLDDEEKSLEGNKAEQNDLMKKLQKDERKYSKQLAEQQRIAKRLDKAIRNIIAKEIAEAAKKEKAKNKGKAEEGSKKKGRVKVPNEELPGTPEAEALSAKFAENRAKLPWPVEKGSIIEHFGVHEHPTLAKVSVNCNGVVIKTAPDAHARCIFGGTVSAVISIPGANNAVIVSHGNYFTVYSNLEQVFVHTGQKLSIREDIGVAGVDKITGDTQVELEIWKAPDTKLNPESWIIRR